MQEGRGWGAGFLVAPRSDSLAQLAQDHIFRFVYVHCVGILYGAECRGVTRAVRGERRARESDCSGGREMVKRSGREFTARCVALPAQECAAFSQPSRTDRKWGAEVPSFRVGHCTIPCHRRSSCSTALAAAVRERVCCVAGTLPVLWNRRTQNSGCTPQKLRSMRYGRCSACPLCA